MTDTIPETGAQASEGNGEGRKYERKVFAALPEGAMRFETVPADAPPIQIKDSTRSEDQKTIDRAAWKAYQAWVATPDKPKEFNKMPRFRFVVPPEHADAVREMLKRAGTFHGINVRVAPTKKHQDGSAIVYFAARAREKRSAQAQAEYDGEEG
jgi:hypothetical protein